jgi:hypothetical protein
MMQRLLQLAPGDGRCGAGGPQRERDHYFVSIFVFVGERWKEKEKEGKI